MTSTHFRQLTISALTLLSVSACTPSEPIAPEGRAGLDLFRMARQVECQELPTEGLRPLLNRQIGDGTTLAWPVAPLVHGAAAASRVLTAQPMLDVTEFGCQLLVAESAADTSFGVAALLLTLRREFPTKTSRYGRAMAAWRRGENAWTLDLYAPLNLIALQEVAVPDSLEALSTPQQLSASSAALLAADSALARAIAKDGVAAALGGVLTAEAVSLPTSGEMLIGARAIVAPLTAVPTTWAWGPQFAGASEDGMVGWTAGGLEATRQVRGNPVTVGARYVAFWKKVGGTWKMFMLGTVPMAPLPD